MKKCLSTSIGWMNLYQKEIGVPSETVRCHSRVAVSICDSWRHQVNGFKKKKKIIKASYFWGTRTGENFYSEFIVYVWH